MGPVPSTAAPPPAPPPWWGIVLAGGRGRRLGGRDKAALEYDGQPLLAHSLRALAGADRVVVVGAERELAPPDPRVAWTREEPAYGGPVAGLVAGLAALPPGPGLVVVLAVDMPRVEARTIRRLLSAARHHERPAQLVGPDGRPQLLLTAPAAALLEAVAPLGTGHGEAFGRVRVALAPVGVAAEAQEHRDVDTEDDLTPS